MTMRPLLAGFIIGILTPLSLLTAGEIAVLASCRDYGFSYYEYNFVLQYTNPEIQTGSKVELLKSYSGHGSFDGGPYQDYWSGVDQENIEIEKDGEGNYLVPLKLFFMATGGYLSGLDFAVKITRPDGSVFWDNGSGTADGTHFYRARFFEPGVMECWHLQSPKDLTISAH